MSHKHHHKKHHNNNAPIITPHMKPYIGGFAALTSSDIGQFALTLESLAAYDGWTNDNCDCVRLRFTHQYICPTKTTRQWDLMDRARELAVEHNKHLRISVAFGLDAAEWIYDNGVTRYSLQNGDGDIQMPWEKSFQNILFPFIDELAQHKTLTDGRSTHFGLEKDPLVTTIIPCGFMQKATMHFIDVADISRVPLMGFPDVYAAWQAGSQAVLAKWRKAFSTSLFEITYAAPIDNPAGVAAGQTLKDWFMAKYPGQAGLMVNAIFANADAGPPTKDTPPHPHGTQEYHACFGTSDQSTLYQNGTTLPDPMTDFNGTFVNMVKNAANRGVFIMEVYDQDFQHIDTAVLTAQRAILKALIAPIHGVPRPHFPHR